MATRSPLARVTGRWRMILWGTLVVLSVTAYSVGVRLNLSSSLPRGAYRLTAVPRVFTPQQLVTIPVPRSVYPFVARWVPIMKPVAGLPGDVVCLDAHRLSINGTDYGPVLHAAHGVPVPRIPEGCQVIPAGQLFLASHAPKSLDSRYFGLIPFTAVTAGATPVWLWEK